MNPSASPVRIAAIATPASRARIESHLAAQGAGEVTWFSLQELHELDRAVRRGKIERVVCAEVADLLQGIWDEEIELDAWPPHVGIEPLVAQEGRDLVESLRRNWFSWRIRHRRRQALAGAVLSALVLAASFCLVQSIRP